MKTLNKYFIEAWNNKPLIVILWLAAIFRLLASVFSRGFGMHDDHFLVIEAAQSWVDGYDYNNWLPGSTTISQPSGHSFFYVGIHYLILLLMKYAGVADPQVKMFLIRLLHGSFSLITVYFGYKIVWLLSDCKTAKITGLLLALLWFFPFISVRNLVEVVCIPFLIYGTWLIIKYWNKTNLHYYSMYAGIVVGLAFSVRFQTMIFAAGLGMVLLIKMKWRESLYYGLGFIVSVVLVQGGIDLFIWGRPFTELGEYIRYNAENASAYITGSWYNYILLILGILLPPISFFIFFGFFRVWKRIFIIFFPTLLFVIFHSLFPNKQERFILPVVPFIIITGMIGWQEFVYSSDFLEKRKKLARSFWIFFWIVNTILLIPVSTTYSKRARVESMTYLSKYPQVNSLIIENSNYDYAKMCPRFYIGKWIREYTVTNVSTADSLSENIISNPDYQPQFVLFFEDRNLPQRVEKMTEKFPHLVFEKEIQPGFIDEVLHWLNPLNANQTIYIYRNQAKIPSIAE